MKIVALFVSIMMIGSSLSGQNLIGYKDVEIKKFMKANQKDMNLAKVVNSKFIYLKYTNRSDSQTLLFFLNTDSICHSIRIICDESIKAEKIKEFNSIYEISGGNKWIDKHDGKDYRIEIKDEDWSSVITIVPGK